MLFLDIQYLTIMNKRDKNKKKYCLVIPIYKYNLDEVDKLSLKSVAKSFYESGNHAHIEIIAPTRFEINIITEDTRNFIKSIFKDMCEVRWNYFDDNYFESTASYSKLLLEKEFYEYFNDDYKYLVLYQLDCYMFRDELDRFVDFDVDYIGAPIYATNSDWGEHPPYVGNGGFSIRKIETFVSVLDRNKQLWLIHKDEFENTKLPKNSDYKYIDFEDIFICQMIGKYYPLTFPNYKDIVNFCWDRNLDYIVPTFHVDTPCVAHNFTLFYNYYKKFIPELTENEYIKNFCEAKIERWKNTFHPEEVGYGNF